MLTGTHRGGVRPDAIVTGSDRLAAMIYGVAGELRLRIGRDLGVTGFDGSVAADLLHPRLTSITIPVEDIARRVVARALRQVDQGSDDSPGEVVPATLRPGESTDGRREPGPGPGSDEVAPIWKRFHGVEQSGAGVGPDGRRVTNFIETRQRQDKFLAMGKKGL